jgi:hypothetical protein
VRDKIQLAIDEYKKKEATYKENIGVLNDQI